MKNDKYVPAVAALTLLMITLLFKEIPILMVAAAPGAQPPGQVPTPSKPEKSSKVDSSVESVKVDSSTPGSQPNAHVPTPPQQHNADSSIGASAAAAGAGYSSCSPSSQCNSHVPTPGCCSRQSKKVQQVRVNAGKEEGLIRDYKASMNSRKHGPVDHTYYY